MKLATYNINSVRLRIERVIHILEKLDLDVLCLQETKCEDSEFPKEAFKKAGYEHLAIRGEKAYNGVAIVSRLPIKEKKVFNFVNHHARHVCANIDGIDIHNFYVPAGGMIPDRFSNEKFEHKLNYVDACVDHFSNKKNSSNAIILGDLNIAPYEHDVWSSKQLRDEVSHTAIEREKLDNFKKAGGFVDIARKFIDENEKIYSWWSYRNRDWRKSNRGRRLDHIWTSANIANDVKSYNVYKDLRDPLFGGEKPSDHVPVVIEL